MLLPVRCGLVLPAVGRLRATSSVIGCPHVFSLLLSSRPLQATTNALLSHFFSLVCSLWLLRIIANRPSAGHMLTSGGASNQIVSTGSNAASPRPTPA